jgi:hypothetical protein
MAASVEKPVGESLILMTFDADADQNHIVAAYHKALDLAFENDLMLYRVVDVRNAGRSAPKIISTLCNIAKGVSYASIMPEMLYIVVGSDDIKGLCARMGLPHFRTYAESVNYVQAQLGDPANIM